MIKGVLLTAALALVPFSASAAKARKRAQADVPLAETLFTVNDTPVSKHAKIFLISGSAASSAFSREIIDQRSIWLAAGFHEDEIECYYPVPFQEDLLQDSKHYIPLARELAPCHRVSVATLRDQLAAAAKANPQFVYVYITSHGDQPVSATLKEARRTDPDYWALHRESRFPVFEQYRIVIEGLKGDTATDAELLGALRAGTSADELFLTPGNLERMLAPLGTVPKFVVLQACHSGGFVEEPSPRLAETLLSHLSAVTVLTAARHDRASFGCEPGAKTTFYGGAFNDELRKVAANPLNMDWRRLYEAVAKRVEKLEKRQKVTPPSLPQYFSSPTIRAADRQRY